MPDELTIARLREWLAEDAARHGFILDGFPRNLAQARPELRHSGAVQVLVVVVARRIVLIPAAAAEAKRLVLRELLAGRELRRGRRGLRVEAGRAHGRQAARDEEEVAAAEAGAREPLLEEFHLLIGDRGTFHA